MIVFHSGRWWSDKGLGGEDTEYEQSSEVQQRAGYLHRGEGRRLFPVLPGEFQTTVSNKNLN